MKKALMYASTASMLQQFNMENVKLLQELGYKVDVVCNFEFGSTISDERIQKLKIELRDLGVDYYHVPVTRKLSDVKNIVSSITQSKKLMDKECYDLIHCHTPIGSVVCRLANRLSVNYRKCRMIYTAHGFHFFKGNSRIKNFIFKTIETFFARYTDVLITINKEDFGAAKQFTYKKGGKCVYVPGIGVDIDRIENISAKRESFFAELNLKSNSKILLSVGELIERKNHQLVIRALPYLRKDIEYVICGKGDESKLIKLAEELGVSDRLHLLGYRTDVVAIVKSSDVFIFPSLQEGLPVALMEALTCGLPCLSSNIRGNSDLQENNILFDLSIEPKALAKVIEKEFDKERTRVKRNMEQFSVKNVKEQMRKIYGKA